MDRSKDEPSAVWDLGDLVWRVETGSSGSKRSGSRRIGPSCEWLGLVFDMAAWDKSDCEQVMASREGLFRTWTRGAAEVGRLVERLRSTRAMQAAAVGPATQRSQWDADTAPFAKPREQHTRLTQSQHTATATSAADKLTSNGRCETQIRPGCSGSWSVERGARASQPRRGKTRLCAGQVDMLLLLARLSALRLHCPPAACDLRPAIAPAVSCPPPSSAPSRPCPARLRSCPARLSLASRLPAASQEGRPFPARACPCPRLPTSPCVRGRRRA